MCEYEFKRGQEIEVWDENIPIITRISLGICVEGARFKHLCVTNNSEYEFKNGLGFYHAGWQHARAKRPDFKIDDPVFVSDWEFSNSNHGEPRRFARWGEGGQIMCFRDGQDSFTGDQCTATRYTNYRVPHMDEMPG